MDNCIRDAKTRILKCNGTESKSRLVDSPQEVLVHILSFLPIECVIQASLVCKRWKDLWMSTPNLNFELQDIYGEGYEIVSTAASRRLSFLNYVNRVLRSRNSCKINSCPLLEKLYLEDCSWTWVKSIHISAPRLASLSIEEDNDNYSSDNCQAFSHVYFLEVSYDTLQALHYKD